MILQYSLSAEDKSKITQLVKAIKNYMPTRAEEIETTFADTTKLENLINDKPTTTFDEE